MTTEVATRQMCASQSCENLSRKRGFCETHYRQFLRTGTTFPYKKYSKTGSVNSSWYRVVVKNGKGILEHRWIMQELIGRILFAHENIHHKNGDKLDNRIENLELWTTHQPKGSRIEDKIAWAKEILDLYGYKVEAK